jgi:hypothetical protein
MRRMDVDLCFSTSTQKSIRPTVTFNSVGSMRDCETFNSKRNGYFRSTYKPLQCTAVKISIFRYITILDSELRTCTMHSFLLSSKSRDSSVGIALGYGLDNRGSRVRFPAGAENFSLHHRVQIGSGAHPVSYPIGIRGSFPGGIAAGA